MIILRLCGIASKVFCDHCFAFLDNGTIDVQMGNSEQILVIILSATLAIFLILGIVALVKLIQILNHLKVISEKAEKLINTAENVGEFFRYTAGPAAIVKLFSNISDVVFKHKKSSKSEEHDG